MEGISAICDDCICSFHGKEVLNSCFRCSHVSVIDNKSINIYVVPELILKGGFKSISDNTTNFIKNGLRTTEKLFSYLAPKEALVYHFLL